MSDERAPVEDFPEGYPRFAALMSSDVNTRLYRRFGIVRNRLLLHKQDQIVRLSYQLANLDKRDEASHPERLYCGRYDEGLGCGSLRNAILQRLENILKEYDELLLREHTIASIVQPTAKNHRSLFDWVYNNKPVVREEYEYLFDQHDFVLLGNDDDHWLRSFQQRIWNMGQHPIFRVRFVDTD